MKVYFMDCTVRLISYNSKRILYGSDAAADSNKEILITDEIDYTDLKLNWSVSFIVKSNNDTGGGSALAQDENESYMRYEFSETRKVLDEFFHKDPAENDR